MKVQKIEECATEMSPSMEKMLHSTKSWQVLKTKKSKKKKSESASVCLVNLVMYTH